MPALLSVRGRLIALVASLVICLGGANLLLGHLISNEERVKAQMWEQHQRLETIHAVVAMMSTHRFNLGQYNSASLINDQAQIAAAQAAVDQSLNKLQAQLSKMAAFDAASTEQVREQLGALPVHIGDGMEAFKAGRQEEANFHIGKVRSSLDMVEKTLHRATSREQAEAEAVRQHETEHATNVMRLSLLIVAISIMLGAILGFWLLQSIMRPLQATVRAMRQVNDGETSVDLPPITHDEFGEMAQALRQFRDQTERLRQLAYNDALTGLGTRARLEEVVERATGQATSDSSPIALMFISLDNLRNVNDSLGHRIGDHYLCEAAVRLQRFAPFGSTLCRFGGDKFVIVLDEIPGHDLSAQIAAICNVARNILIGLSEPFPFRDHLLPMTASIGVGMYPADGESFEGLITAAETAMYTARRTGGNSVQFAKADFRTTARDRLQLISDIRRAIEVGEFQAHFQPIVDTDTNRVIAAEALLRWQHPARGLLLPGEFIQIAEESGLIRSLGEHCLLQACEQAALWRKAGHPIRLSINLSARQIEDRTILPALQRISAAALVPPESVDFEITETAMLEHIDHAHATLTEIRSLGYRISVDDFGTGYSSLAYVQRYPIDKIKIDRSFVAKLEYAREARAIVSATMALAQRLDLECVAEGVETSQQMRLLRDISCTLQQGFYFSPALAPENFLPWVLSYESRSEY
ncbi:sensor domain-containing phosphodiesterase [Algiphilus sp. W345]|uniref:Sensor domain-containing phosphodiesterase n=1 Tax=Banduia mediterranea TaxID=3075609 RepID=A0ABU2WEX1_9GAMM|nr:sensor domain-containing phosphodiesterase [Algiphilus sp. W345]MDT0496075.1 sensor domain-containing phosphodiesterase [Algiphilus sp. W345]